MKKKSLITVLIVTLFTFGLASLSFSAQEAKDTAVKTEDTQLKVQDTGKQPGGNTTDPQKTGDNAASTKDDNNTKAGAGK